MDQIQAQANRIFRMLSASEQLVVLFDEFDEMVRNRAVEDEVLSRFLTTAMLPKLAKISKERRILFIVATNYIRSFDIAISRPGRFDLLVQMMPPLAEEKLRFPSWKMELKWLRRVIRKRKSFTTQLADLTYLETDKLVARIRQLMARPKGFEAKAEELWREAVEGCTLNRANERYPAAAGRYPTWRDTAREEVSLIRWQ
jgi:SpoVK/Ycf46/Vps4 family AAA+-type ATPase